jgi:hypothetical protein
MNADQLATPDSTHDLMLNPATGRCDQPGCVIDPPLQQSSIGSLILAAELVHHLGEPDVSISIGSVNYDITVQVYGVAVPEAARMAEALGLPFGRYSITATHVQSWWTGRVNGVDVSIVILADPPQWPEHPLALPA